MVLAAPGRTVPAFRRSHQQVRDFAGAARDRRKVAAMATRVRIGKPKARRRRSLEVADQAGAERPTPAGVAQARQAVEAAERFLERSTRPG
jgi:hypothetical protein